MIGSRIIKLSDADVEQIILWSAYYEYYGGIEAKDEKLIKKLLYRE